MLRRVKDILVHHRAVFCKLSVGETILVDNLHLFHYGTLSWLVGAYETPLASHSNVTAANEQIISAEAVVPQHKVTNGHSRPHEISASNGTKIQLWRQKKSVEDKGSGFERPKRYVYKGHLKYSPNNKILCSFFNCLLSSWICLSIASERSFAERSAFDTKLPIHCVSWNVYCSEIEVDIWRTSRD